MSRRARRRLRLALAVPLAALAAASATRSAGVPEPPLVGLQALDSPAAPGSGEPSLAAAPDGRIWLSWIEPGPARAPAAAGSGAGVHRLRCASFDGARWSAPLTIAEGDSFFVNWADVPSLTVLPNGGLVAYWLWRTGASPFAYEIRLSTSRDGGASWTQPVRAHDDVSNAAHGFVSMVPEGEGVRLVWLDGRKGAGLPEGAADTELRTALLKPSGSVVDERPIDPRVCDCCATAATLAPGGVLVAYRDRDAEEVRDISVERLRGRGWTGPAPLHADGWTVRGCPVNGPSLASAGNRVAAAWFTGEGDRPRVLAAFSEDGGSSFGAPVAVDRGAPLGRVQVAMLPDRSALVLWLGSERPSSGGRYRGLIRVARVTADGGAGAPLTVARPSWARASGVPRMALARGQVVFAWTEAGSSEQPGVRPVPKQVRLAAAKLSASLNERTPAR